MVFRYIIFNIGNLENIKKLKKRTLSQIKVLIGIVDISYLMRRFGKCIQNLKAYVVTNKGINWYLDISYLAMEIWKMHRELKSVRCHK